MRKINPLILAAILAIVFTADLVFSAFRFDQLETKTVDFLGQGPPGLSAAGNGRMYFDNVSNHFFCSENGGAFRVCGPIVAGSDQQIQYNRANNFGADSHLLWDYTNFIFSILGTGPGEITLGGDILANLGAPSDGTIANCVNCNAGSSPCSITGSPHGAIAERLNGVWECGGGGGVFGTVNTIAKFTSANVLGNSGITDDSATVTIGFGESFNYTGALFISGTGVRAISTSVSALATDRDIECTSGSSTDKTYTLPTATGSHRRIDLTKVDTGTKSCIAAVPSGALNQGTIDTLTTVWQSITCSDRSAGQWHCRGTGTIS